MKTVFLFVLISFSTQLCAQTTEQDTLMKSYLTQVKAAIAKQDYKAANDYLKKAFALKKTLPDEAAYYHGVVLFQQKKYVPAKTSFQKYISLTGKKGMYNKESEEYLLQADQYICRRCNETGFIEKADTCDVCHGTGKVNVPCKTCRAKGVVFCQPCGGSGVAKHAGSFGGTYQNCPTCHGKGYHDCPTCLGKKLTQDFCEHCAGKGLLKTKVNCDHKMILGTGTGKLK